MCQTTLFLGRIKAEDDEATIKERVLKDYDETMPPILYARKEHDTYTVLSVFRVQGIDEVKGEFVFEGIIHFLWTDERLTWESENIKGIRVASYQIWTPFIRILNKVAKPKITLRPPPIIFQGGVWWGPRGVFRTACIPNLKYFPFDEHICEVEIVSVSEEGDLLQMNYSELSVTHTTYVRRNFIIENPLWNVLSVTSSKTRMEVDVGIVSDVGVFTFQIQRSMPLIVLGILTPSLMSVVLLLVTFWMKQGTVPRTAINTTSLLVSAGNLLAISRIIPVHGSVTPIIVEYVTSVLVLSLLSSLQAVNGSLLARYTKQPPFLTWMGKLPKWAFLMLALVPPTEENVDETYLFSELSEIDQGHTSTENNEMALPLEYPWEKHILFLDRLLFYVFGIVILLLIISVMLTE
ncbi:acetylcholine receptor subunit delta [Trichonephila inaurata madagascariensis]|uniref:Acetylcholine receptor subunit delta n=1 Tax=Trichonephila inaurata madagascariensis TaxID=2747483 RepID=A0A8X6XTM1_9ARAC|nr:acetylcholine receptor subunit delta [Trichonephila inaurata madagascariensis]